MCLGFDWWKRGDSLRDIQIITCFKFRFILTLIFVTTSLSRQGCKQPFHRLFGRLAFVVVYGIVCKPTSNPFESLFQSNLKKQGRTASVRLCSHWRRLRDSNPRGLAPKRFSRPPRYDRFDKPPHKKIFYILSKIVYVVKRTDGFFTPVRFGLSSNIKYPSLWHKKLR